MKPRRSNKKPKPRSWVVFRHVEGVDPPIEYGTVAVSNDGKVWADRSVYADHQRRPFRKLMARALRRAAKHVEDAKRVKWP